MSHNSLKICKVWFRIFENADSPAGAGGQSQEITVQGPGFVQAVGLLQGDPHHRAAAPRRECNENLCHYFPGVEAVVSGRPAIKAICLRMHRLCDFSGRRRTAQLSGGDSRRWNCSQFETGLPRSAQSQCDCFLRSLVGANFNRSPLSNAPGTEKERLFHGRILRKRP